MYLLPGVYYLSTLFKDEMGISLAFSKNQYMMKDCSNLQASLGTSEVYLTKRDKT